ncbi:hypothetical protein Q4595_21380, partial [Wenyingzhuangia sp. 1_MG-2023]|nr:hypothetical protein [Wenyingzhuangia sp. 1_MG-2023]
CGAARSLRGLGSIGAPSSGNFFMAGGWVGGYSNNGLHGSQGVILADQSGSITSDDRYRFNWPFSDSGGAFGNNIVDSIVELELRPVEIWAGATTSVADAYQQCRLPMLLSSPGLNYQVTDRIST